MLNAIIPFSFISKGILAQYSESKPAYGEKELEQIGGFPSLRGEKSGTHGLLKIITGLLGPSHHLLELTIPIQNSQAKHNEL